MKNNCIKNSLFLFLLILCFNFKIKAQSSMLPLGRDDYQWLDRLSIRDGKLPEDFNTFNKTYDRKMLMQYISNLDSNNLDSSGAKWSKVDEKNVQYLYNDNFEYAADKAQIDGAYPILNSIYKYKTDFYAFDDANFLVKLNPVIFYQGGHSSSNSEYKFFNTRGLELKGNILNKIGFYTYIGENQMKAPDFVQNYISTYHAVPGEGYYKSGFKKTGVDFFDARGYVTFSAAKYVHFTFGQDKIFLGDGIRSLFISDVSNASPFLRINFHYKQFDYENLFLELTKQWNITKGDQYTFPKYAAMHHLSYNATNNLQFGLFESVIFSRNHGFELAYLNPIIFYRQVEQSLGSPDNAAIGFDGKWNLMHHVQLYGQFLLDDFNFAEFKINHKWWGEKYALQAGLKYVDVFGIKNLDAQAEINFIRPFVYSHSDSLGNYTNYNQPLAHPMGANLKEMVVKIYFQPIQKITFTVIGALTNQGLDVYNDQNKLLSDWGSNPLISNLQRYQGSNSIFATGNGVSTNIYNADLVMSWRIAHNVYFDFNFLYRKLTSADSNLDKNEKFFGIGFRMNTSRPKFLF